MGVTGLAATARLASDLLDVARVHDCSTWRLDLLDVARRGSTWLDVARRARRGWTTPDLTAFGEPITLELTAFGEPFILVLTAFGEPISRELVE